MCSSNCSAGTRGRWHEPPRTDRRLHHLADALEGVRPDASRPPDARHDARHSGPAAGHVRVRDPDRGPAPAHRGARRIAQCGEPGAGGSAPEHRQLRHRGVRGRPHGARSGNPCGPRHGRRRDPADVPHRPAARADGAGPGHRGRGRPARLECRHVRRRAGGRRPLHGDSLRIRPAAPLRSRSASAPGTTRDSGARSTSCPASSACCSRSR